MTVNVAIIGKNDYSVPLCGAIEWMKTLSIFRKADLKTLQSLNMIDGRILSSSFDGVMKELERAMDYAGVEPATLLKFIQILKKAKDEQADYILMC